MRYTKKMIEEKHHELYKEMEKPLSSLYWRWDDEKEYEDFKDYIAHAKKKIEELGVTFIGMKKSPFSIFYSVAGYKGELRISKTKYTGYDHGYQYHPEDEKKLRKMIADIRLELSELAKLDVHIPKKCYDAAPIAKFFRDFVGSSRELSLMIDSFIRLHS